MSRRSLVPNDAQPAGTVIAVGWDRPLRTFFAQVLRIDDDGEDDVIVWVGTACEELTTAAAAVAVVAPYADIPTDLAAQLETDRLKTLGSFDGGQQRDARRFLDRNRDR